MQNWLIDSCHIYMSLAAWKAGFRESLADRDRQTPRLSDWERLALQSVTEQDKREQKGRKQRGIVQIQRKSMRILDEFSATLLLGLIVSIIITLK